MKKEDLTKTEFKKVAEELNEQLGLEPPILKGLAKNALSKAITEAASLIDQKNDEFSDYVWEVMEAMGVAQRPEEPEEEPPNDAAVAELIEEANGDTLVEDFKACKKLKELKAMAAEWDLFQSLDLAVYTGLGGMRQLKDAMLACMPEDVQKEINDAPKTKAAAKPKKTGVSQTDFIRAEFIKGVTKEELIPVLAEKYEKKPGWAKARINLFLKYYPLEEIIGEAPEVEETVTK